MFSDHCGNNISPNADCLRLCLPSSVLCGACLKFPTFACYSSLKLTLSMLFQVISRFEITSHSVAFASLQPQEINFWIDRARRQTESRLGVGMKLECCVHQIARNFRDRWLLLGPLRKRSCIDRDDCHINTHSGSQYNRCLASQNQWLGCKPSEGAEYTCHSTVASVQADASVLDGSSGSCSDIGAACRPSKHKRESRWDQEAEAKSDPKNESDVADNQRQVVDDDVPPGFSVPVKAFKVLSDDSSTAIYSTEESSCGEHPQPVFMGQLQQQFISRLPVSYGIPFSEVQLFGSPQKGICDAWTVAPGIPFQPFPPLPPYPCDRRDIVPAAANPGIINELPQNAGEDWGTCSPGYLAQNPPSVSGADQPQGGNKNKHGPKRASDSHNFGRKHFRKQKYNNSKLVPPWIRIRSGWEYAGNNLKNSMCIAGVPSRENEFRSVHSWVEHDLGMQNLGHALRHNTFYRY
ncbi:hypothetical protein FXO37_31242 [Capsicum annuum]|nr:hypothetical protein FXO37_31242 [Capsicum annuum]